MTNDSLDDEDSEGNEKPQPSEYSLSEEERERIQPHRFKKLEILGDNIKQLRNPGDFFLKLFQKGCENIEEIIIDGILRRHQLADMVRGLYAVL